MALFADQTFLADPAIFSRMEKEIVYCLQIGDIARVLQRLIEAADPTDKREKKVRPRFAGAILERLFEREKLPAPTLLTAIAQLPFTPEPYRHFPRQLAQMIENAMMGLQVQADEQWVEKGAEIAMARLLKDRPAAFSATELAFFRLRAKGDHYFHARAYLSAWKAFYAADQLLPGRLKDHVPYKRTGILVAGTRLGRLLAAAPALKLTPEQLTERASFFEPPPPAVPALPQIEVNHPTGNLRIQGDHGVLIEDASESYLEAAFTDLPAQSVYRLELRFCQLPGGKLPNVFFRFPHLTHLTIDTCNLARLTNNLAGFKQLRHLTIINAPKLTDLPLKLGGLTSLRALTIERSGITDIPFSILACRELQTLSISNSRLTCVNGFLGELPQLTHAAFHHNHLEEVAEDFVEAAHLKTLDLSSNRLQGLPDRLHALHRLELLNISQNPLTSIPAGILYMNALHYLKIDSKTINQLAHYASFKADLRKKISAGEVRWQQWQELW